MPDHVQRVIDVHRHWVYCMDCGLLIEPWEQGKKKTTICNICKQVYTQTSHPWLQRMLAEHLNNPKRQKFSVQKTFMCRRCGNYFLHCGANRREKTCKWCTILSPKTDKKIMQCTICNRVLRLRYNTRRAICKECVIKLEEIKAALKCTFHILGQARRKKHPYIALNTKEIENE